MIAKSLEGPSTPKASTISLPPSLLRLLPAGATVAGRGSHPLEDSAFSRRTQRWAIRRLATASLGNQPRSATRQRSFETVGAAWSRLARPPKTGLERLKWLVRRGARVVTGTKGTLTFGSRPGRNLRPAPDEGRQSHEDRSLGTQRWSAALDPEATIMRTTASVPCSTSAFALPRRLSARSAPSSASLSPKFARISLLLRRDRRRHEIAHSVRR